jgi:hypothetical protein
VKAACTQADLPPLSNSTYGFSGCSDACESFAGAATLCWRDGVFLGKQARNRGAWPGSSLTSQCNGTVLIAGLRKIGAVHTLLTVGVVFGEQRQMLQCGSTGTVDGQR